MTDRTITEKETMKKTGANKTKVKANAGIRLNRFIAMHTGVSRRNADDIIKEERVLINGKKIKNLATAVKEGDEVAVDGKKIKYKEEPKIYIMLNKPQGYITAVKSEEGFKTVMELIKKETLKYKHIFPAGRLDFMSEGLLLLTNDGDFAYKLTHPKFDVVKTYIVEAKGELTSDLFNRIKKGVKLEGAGLLKPDEVRVVRKNPSKFILSVDLSHGKNREIRRIMEFFNLKILMLRRVRIGGLYIGDLPSGEYRILNRKTAELAIDNADKTELRSKPQQTKLKKPDSKISAP
ncbi:MAG: pseudouridine synthase [Deltaproteobacteria bacterium]|nr:pseudouridine synthase [Deltaproteobacteria bacterium]